METAAVESKAHVWSGHDDVGRRDVWDAGELGEDLGVRAALSVLVEGERPVGLVDDAVRLGRRLADIAESCVRQDTRVELAEGLSREDNRVLNRDEADDLVRLLLERNAEDETVLARAAGQLVLLLAAIDRVVAAERVDAVLALLAEDRVVILGRLGLPFDPVIGVDDGRFPWCRRSSRRGWRR